MEREPAEGFGTGLDLTRAYKNSGNVVKEVSLTSRVVRGVVVWHHAMPKKRVTEYSATSQFTTSTMDSEDTVWVHHWVYHVGIDMNFTLRKMKCPKYVADST